jgi:hypothetical protein
MYTQCIAALLGFLIPTLAFALPPNVTNIHGNTTPEGIHVTWDPVQDAVAYRVYYSRESILARNGIFDDFEMSDGATTELVLTSFPQASGLFVSVLAVDTKGNESPLFTQEAYIDLSALPATNQPAQGDSNEAPPEPSQPSANDIVTQRAPLRVLEVIAASTTEVHVRFSDPVHIADPNPQSAFSITAPDATALTISDVLLEGNVAKLITQPQAANGVYQLVVRSSVRGATENGYETALEGEEISLLFMAVTNAETQEQAPQPIPLDVEGFALRATPETPDTYTLEAQWSVPKPENVQGFLIAQSIDGGKTFGTPQQLSRDTRGIQIHGVPASTFGILVQIIDAAGTASTGVSQYIELQAQGVPQVRGTPVAQVLPSKNDLPSTGFGLPLLFAMVGMLAGGTIVTRRYRHGGGLYA